MALKVFSLFDRKAGSFGQPVFHSHRAEAVRSITAAVNAPGAQSALALFPADFDLFECGEWSFDAGVIHRETDNADFVVNLGTLKEATNG